MGPRSRVGRPLQLGGLVSEPALIQAQEIAHQASESYNDPWCEILEERLVTDKPPTTSELWSLLGVPPERRSSTLRKRLGRVMVELGFSTTSRTPGVATVWIK